MLTSLASVIGMGSIVGVASAIITGGPGAVLWMWVAALIGMIIKYGEIILIIAYREKDDEGEYVGGPALYMEKALGRPGLGKLVVALMVIVCLTSVMIQSNVVVENVFNMLPVSETYIPIISLVAAFLSGLVVVGGIQRIGNVAEKLIPFMSIFYLIAAIIVILFNWENILPALGSILRGGFQPVEVAGGFVGYGISQAMQYGTARGFFVSGAGQSVFTVSHATGRVKNPTEQAIFGVTEVFLVTIICTGTALAVLTSGVPYVDANAATLVTDVFESVHPLLGVMVAIATILFSFSTVIGLGYIGESQLATVTSAKNARIYRYVFLVFAFLGGIGALSAIWDVTDLFLALVMIVNLAVMVILSKEIFKISNDYWENYDAREENKKN
jgi:AGCS family alanine or glycine:cation symporter